MDKILKKLRDEISDKCDTQEMKQEALRIFHRAYNEHKEIHGSYKNLTGKEYQKRIQERYDFMFTQAMNYIAMNYINTMKRDEEESPFPMDGSY